jgi:hypothetical protein
VALAEALTVNKTLHTISLSTEPVFTDGRFPDTDELGTPAYEAFSAMLRGNTGINLQLPPFHYTSGDQRLIESHDQMIIEKRLNQVGRGRLLTPSNHTTREQRVDALHDLSTDDVNNAPSFRVSCLYSLLRLKPSVVCKS